MTQLILIGNYRPDRQESMERFAQMLSAGFRVEGIHTILWRPTVFFGKLVASTTTGLGKWLGYIDKWLVFPLVIYARRLFLKPGIQWYFHVCDHSNAFYLRQLPAATSAITCHDVLAIRGAFGHADAYCPASPTGKIMQGWILRNLIRANKVAAVSTFTLNQLHELAGDAGKKKNGWVVIHNALNADFKPMDPEVAHQQIRLAGVDPKVPFILHVGSRLPRKNRKMLLDMGYELRETWDGAICFAGQPLDDELIAHAQTLGLEDRVIAVVKPGHELLNALYTTCTAFVFPSFSEGFGWPVIEAQACGAPVIASSTAPMPEVSGGAALHADPADARAFADAFRALSDMAVRSALTRDGLHNSERFTTRKMIRAYAELHQLPLHVY